MMSAQGVDPSSGSHDVSTRWTRLVDPNVGRLEGTLRKVETGAGRKASRCRAERAWLSKAGTSQQGVWTGGSDGWAGASL
eukprot:1111369-Prorocentrum_minimum.AAC.7